MATAFKYWSRALFPEVRALPEPYPANALFLVMQACVFLACIMAVPGFCLGYALETRDNDGSGACDLSATWLAVLAGLQLAQILHGGAVLLTAELIFPGAVSPWLFGYPCIAIFCAHTAVLLYGCVRFTQMRGDYHGCQTFSIVAQVYVWLSLIMAIAVVNQRDEIA